MNKILTLVMCVLGVMSCSVESNKISFLSKTTIPICEHCQSPNMYQSEDGSLYISYIRTITDKAGSDKGLDILEYRKYENGMLSEAIKVNEGRNWFVNWADVPSITTFGIDGSHLFAHWLQMSDSGTYDYDVRYSISNDTEKAGHRQKYYMMIKYLRNMVL